MSLPKRSADYPQQLVAFALAASGIDANWKRTLTFTDTRAAQHWRMLFYGFRKACERDNPHLADLLRPITAAIRGNTIEFSHRDGMALMAGMDELIKSMPLPPVQAAPVQAKTPHESHNDTIMRLFGIGQPTEQTSEPEDGALSNSESAP